jgi:hypothetical protein
MWLFLLEFKLETEELVIDKTNFSEYFHDVRYHRAQAGEVMAKFMAVAVFGSGPEKRDIINILKKDKAHAAAMVMRKIHSAKEPDCYRVCREICEDLMNGMTDDQVCEKDYEFTLEMFYYVKREYVPKNDPHWVLIPLMQYDTESQTFKSSIEL